MSDLDSTESWEDFGENPIDYNPLFETTIDFETLDDAFNWAKKIAFENGHGKPKESDDLEKLRRSQKCSCKFRIRAVQNFVSKNDKETVVWNIVTSEGAGLHNHNIAVYKDGDRHFAGLDVEEKAYVRQQTLAGVLPRDIKNGLHLRTPEKPQPSSTQLYNETRKIKKEVMGEGNTAQQMLALAVEAKYVHWHELTHIFMAHPEAIKLFRAYPYVVLMDSTYKTNVYKNPLIDMVGVTPTGSSFLIACSMIPTKSDVNYKWLLRKLDAILDATGVASPAVFVTDRELGLISALEQVFPRAEHLLCRWHVNKAINAKALTSYKTESMRKHVISNEEDGWFKVINAVTEESFQRAWQCFQRKWPKMEDYVRTAWGQHAGKFVLCNTNEVLHFGNTTTSCVESAHSLLKAWLKSKHLTLDSMWSRIHDMLESQHSKIKKELEDEMSKPRRTSRTFSLLQGNVSIKAIELMEKELTRGLALGIGVDDRCRHVIRMTRGLPCACNLASLHGKGRRVHLEDIHVFWKTLVYDIPQQMPKNDGDLWEKLVDDVRHSDPVKLRAAIDLLRDFHHTEDQEILPPPINEHPKGRPRDQSQQRLGDFESGPPGAPLGRNFTIVFISTWVKWWGSPEVLWGHIDGWVDVGDDGHCGFRVISHAQRGQETDYIVMQEWCSREMRTDSIYTELYGGFQSPLSGVSGLDIALRRVEFFQQISCGQDHWMFSDDLLVFATLFNWTICVIGHTRRDGKNVWEGSCKTIMPFKTRVEGRLTCGILWIVLHHSHWMRLHSRSPLESLPMPPLDPAWLTFRDPSAVHLETLYQQNIENWQAFMLETPRKRCKSRVSDSATVISVSSCSH
ncbi:uncharacterized protein LOC141601432 [Silene latifolia]|uniref:uncharacterized protein LOC141601432 n=1 Tax=Silene latifolia TaxID=37657 RepID=UPI003D770CFD